MSVSIQRHATELNICIVSDVSFQVKSFGPWICFLMLNGKLIILYDISNKNESLQFLYNLYY